MFSMFILELAKVFSSVSRYGDRCWIGSMCSLFKCLYYVMLLLLLSLIFYSPFVLRGLDELGCPTSMRLRANNAPPYEDLLIL